MKKYKTRQNETLKDGLFPQCFPNGKNGGETKQSGIITQSLERVVGNSPKERIKKMYN
jgi:hypothetical protein